jgi:hypothetical protein
MGEACCKPLPTPTTRRSTAQRRILWIVLVINVVLFGGEFIAGWLADSTALQADSLDSLGDAFVYGLSLAVVGGTLRARAGAALAKGGIQALFGLAILAQLAYRLLTGADRSLPRWLSLPRSRSSATRPASACSVATAAMTSTCVRYGCVRATTWSATSRDRGGGRGGLDRARVARLPGRRPRRAVVPAHLVGRVAHRVAAVAATDGREQGA